MNNNAGAAIAPLFCLFIGCGLGLVIYVAFLLTLHRALTAVRIRNQDVTPGLVWLMLIPVFSWFWSVYLVLKIATSLQKEFEDRRWSTANESFGRFMGLVWTVGNLLSCPIGFASGFIEGLAQDEQLEFILNIVNCGVSIMLVACWIIYWVQVAGYARLLNERATDGQVHLDPLERGRPRWAEDIRPPQSPPPERENHDEREFRDRYGFRPRRPDRDDDPHVQ